MAHFRWSLLFTIAVLLVPHSIMATTLTVGTCKSPHYPTISAAVAAAPSGAIVQVCPGTYPEQVVIGTPLTLEGIASGNADRAVITVPGNGFPTTVTTLIGGTVTPQVLVTVPGVNISNITVDGAGASISTTYLAGIFYESGSSGIVKEDTTRNQTSIGAGIWAENGNPTSESVTIENSSVHDVDWFGIFVASNQTPPTLTATILKNYVTVTSYISIYNYNANASITSNVISGSQYGVVMLSNSVGSITSNTVSNAGYAIFDEASTSNIKSNLILNSTYFAIEILSPSNATIESNTIRKAPVGIEFGCSAGPTVKSNTISDVTTGLDFVPLSVVSPNTYDNVDTIRNGGCGFAPTTALPLPQR